MSQRLFIGDVQDFGQLNIFQCPPSKIALDERKSLKNIQLCQIFTLLLCSLCKKKHILNYHEEVVGVETQLCSHPGGPHAVLQVRLQRGKKRAEKSRRKIVKLKTLRSLLTPSLLP